MIDLMPEPTQDTNDTTKPERIRLIIDTEEVIRAAVRLRALKTGKDNSEAVNDILREALASEIAEVRRYPQFAKKPNRKPKD